MTQKALAQEDINIPYLFMVAIPEIKPFHGQQSRQPSWQDRQEKGSAFTTKSFLMCG